MNTAYGKLGGILMTKGIKKSKSGIVFDSLNILFMIVFCLTTLYPFLFLLSLSFSPADVSFAKIHIIPPRLSLVNYARVFSSEYISSGFVSTISRTVLGTFLTLVASLLTAYPLSKKYFPHRSFWTGFIVFTMFFSGGLIPNYLLMKQLQLFNSVWALVLPSLIPTFSMIIMRNYLMALPESLEESAKIDGANEFTILFRIIVPVSMPIIATVLLWTAVAHWNAWFDSLIYIQNQKKQVLQVVLRRIVIEGTSQMMDLNSYKVDDTNVNPETVKAATTMVVTVPIILLYPFVQKYFIKGIMIGSLKG